MLQTRSSVLRLARRSRLVPQRRFESSHKSPEAHNGTHDAHPTVPKNESFGKGLYIMLAVAPVAWLIYTGSNNASNQPSFLSKWIPDFKEEWEKRNELHSIAVEQAATDKALFLHAPRRQNVELQFNEVFNTGSPYNRHSSDSVNLEGVINFYKQKNKETEERITKMTPEQIYAARSS